jgi:hypothetical protein
VAVRVPTRVRFGKSGQEAQVADGKVREEWTPDRNDADAS